MSRVAISIQTLDGRKDTYLRKEIGTLNKRSVLEAVEEMLSDPEAHNIGKFKPKPTFKLHPAKTGDEDQDLKDAIQGIAAAAV